MLERLRRAGRRAVRLASPAPAILLYHRVASPQFDPWGLAVAPATFDAQMAWLARHRRPLSIDAFVEGLDRGRLPRGAVAITFDDGYLDNLQHARPTLQRYAMTATLFLATGYVADGGSYWWDRLADAILASPGRADWTLTLGERRLRLRWTDGERADPAWRASYPPAGPRERAFLEIWTVLQRLSGPARDQAMRTIAARHPAPPTDDTRAMRADELRRLTADGVFTLGAHTVTHPALTTLDETALRQELETSRDECALLAGRPVAGFAYPYGDMNGSVRAAVAAAGYRWACSTEPAAPSMRPAAEARFALPRVIPPDAGAQALARVLRGL